MIKKFLWSLLLIFIAVIVIYGFYNNISFRINSSKIYNENTDINISSGPNFWGERTWEYEFNLNQSGKVKYAISKGILSKNSKFEIINDKNQIVKSVELNKNENNFINLDKGQYKIKIYYYKGIFNNISFSFGDKNVEVISE